MAILKSTNLNLRIAPEVREALRQASEREHRSVSNMVEYLMVNYCQANGIEIKKPSAKQQLLYDFYVIGTALNTPYHAKYYASELLRRSASNSTDKLSMSLFDASVDLNPHQIEAAMFAFRSPLSKGVLLADEVGLGKV